jgi:hypothetical protein
LDDVGKGAELFGAGEKVSHPFRGNIDAPQAKNQRVGQWVGESKKQIAAIG